MGTLDLLIQGLGVAIQPINLLYALIGVTLSLPFFNIGRVVLRGVTTLA